MKDLIKEKYERYKFVLDNKTSFDEKLDIFKFGVAVGRATGAVIHKKINNDIYTIDEYAENLLKDETFGRATSMALYKMIEFMKEYEKILNE